MSLFTSADVAALTATLNKHLVDNGGDVPGLVAVLASGDSERHVIALGRLALEADAAPTRPDTIYRIMSMTKAVTAAVAMMLVEDGTWALSDPIDKLVPELANRQVLKDVAGPLNETVPAQRAITLEDVLTFRLGMGIMFGDEPIAQAVNGLYGFGMPDPSVPMSAAEWLQKLSALPLMAQPGERWLYTFGSNLLGEMIARACKTSLGEVFRRRVFEPLGMRDTAFHYTPEQQPRVATGYFKINGELVFYDGAEGGKWSKPPAFEAGDAGLISTGEDFDRFARFLETGCGADGRVLLSQASLTAMRTNQLTSEQIASAGVILEPGCGWGYGMDVVVDSAAQPQHAPEGAYGWKGGAGTGWRTDLRTGARLTLMTQRVFDGPQGSPVHWDFEREAFAILATKPARASS